MKKLSEVIDSLDFNKINYFSDSPYYIPTIDEVNKIIEGYNGNHSTVFNEQIELLIKISKTFPKMHNYLVNENGKPEFPPFNLPSVFCSRIVRYIGVLLKNNGDYEINNILYFFENISIYGTENEKIVSDDYFLDYLYLLGDNKIIILELLPKNLKQIYNEYYK